MVQRIQTIWLLLSLAAWGMLFFNPIMMFTSPDSGPWNMHLNAIKTAASGDVAMKTVPLFILVLLVESFTLVSVFLFKKRVLQMRITLYTMILQILTYGMIALYAILGSRFLNAKAGLLFFSAAPAVAFVFSFLAFRSIRLDILLLKTINRLR